MLLCLNAHILNSVMKNDAMLSVIINLVITQSEKRCPEKCVGSCFTTNVRLVCKGLPVGNTLAYLTTEASVTTKKSYITLVPGSHCN
jgi:hypothetical protein